MASLVQERAGTRLRLRAPRSDASKTMAGLQASRSMMLRRTAAITPSTLRRCRAGLLRSGADIACGRIRNRRIERVSSCIGEGAIGVRASTIAHAGLPRRHWLDGQGESQSAGEDIDRGPNS
jgi:hypothetical protein